MLTGGVFSSRPRVRDVVFIAQGYQAFSYYYCSMLLLLLLIVNTPEEYIQACLTLLHPP